MRVLATASSPLQLINAAEAVNHYCAESDSKHLVIRALKGTNNEKIILEVLSNQEWDSVYWYSSKRKMLQLPSLLTKFKGTHWDYVMGGDLTAWWYNSLLANVVYDKHVLYDDGAKTIVDYNNCLVDGLLPEKKKGLKDLLLRFLGLKVMNRSLSYLDVFTTFDLSKTKYCTVVHNAMPLMRTFVRNKKRSEDGMTLIVGQPLVDINAVSWKDYSESLGKIKSSSKQGAMYVAHRGETKGYLDLIEQQLGLKVIKPVSPLEIELCKIDYPIARIVGFTSTALYTLGIIYEDIPVWRIVLDESMYTSEEVRVASKMYHEYFAKYIDAIEI